MYCTALTTAIQDVQGTGHQNNRPFLRDVMSLALRAIRYMYIILFAKGYFVFLHRWAAVTNST